jgi:hypothetical protein
MIRTFIALLIVALCFVNAAHSQSRIITTSDSSRSTSIDGFARDFYFCQLENYELQQGGKYYQAYIVAKSQTTIHIAVGKTSANQFSVNALEELVFDAPLAWEMTQSGVVEDKAVHVWSDDADLSVSLLSRNPATSDGITLVPTSAWGREYVVAAFASYAYLPGYELPSEFAIIAKEDSTVVTITPTTDLRLGISTAVIYPRFVTFTVTLNRGQCVQYQASAANGNMEDYDVTGTVLQATKPIGVSAGVMCANVPAENPYCDHLCEMLLPISQWGNEYVTVPFINRKGGDGILVIAKEDNTTITRSSTSGVVTHCILNKYQTYMRHDIDEASKWKSDKPFLLVQYINSTDYPETGANNGIGDPAMVVVPPLSLFEKEFVFQTPKIRTAETQYRNYANLIIHKTAVNSTSVDGKPVASVLQAVPSGPGDYITYRWSDVKPGVHTVSSDSGAGVYVYGYGSYDAYAWPMRLGAFARSNTDTLAPTVKISTACFGGTVTITDLGSPASGQLLAAVDSAMNLLVGSIVYSGTKRDKLTYSLKIKDSSLSALAMLTVVDAAGNRRKIKHSYAPDLPTMPDGTYIVKAPIGVDREFALPITSGSAIDLARVRTQLRKGTRFKIKSSPQSVAAGQTDSIRITYAQTTIDDQSDTLVVTADCWTHRLALKGSAEPFSAWGVQDTLTNFGLVIVGNERTRKLTVSNLGTEPFAVDSATISNLTDFSMAVGTMPVTVPRGGTLEFDVIFHPSSDGIKLATVKLYTSLGIATVFLTGEGKDLSAVDRSLNEESVQVFPNPANTTLTVKVAKGLGAEVGQLRILNSSGTILLERRATSAETYELDLGGYASGSYILELVLGSGEPYRYKFSIQH